jgi:hypothetical protein
MLIRTGADQATAAPAPIRLSIFRREMPSLRSSESMRPPLVPIRNGLQRQPTNRLGRLREFSYAPSSLPTLSRPPTRMISAPLGGPLTVRGIEHLRHGRQDHP